MMDELTRRTIYNMGYDCPDFTPNPFPDFCEGYDVWKQGYDDSIRNNAQNLPPDHPDVIRLDCGYKED
jgi:hypothetical protein